MSVLSAFWRIVQWGAKEMKAHIILVDIGPNLGAINRAALIASDFFVTPLGADIFSLQGLRNLGPTVMDWRKAWKKRRSENPPTDPDQIEFDVPMGRMRPIGYVVNQPGSVRLDRPVQAYEKWVKRIPNDYRKFILGEPEEFPLNKLPNDDPHCLTMAKHYRSLVPMAQEARKPIFGLIAADGATGSHFVAAQKARDDFKNLTSKILNLMGVQIPAD